MFFVAVGNLYGLSGARDLNGLVFVIDRTLHKILDGKGRLIFLTSIGCGWRWDSTPLTQLDFRLPVTERSRSEPEIGSS
jgi:hypothetical protein